MFILKPIPDSTTETSERPTQPGTAHGEYGPRLVITRTGGFSCSTSTGYWRWCEPCGAWQKGTGIIAAMLCPKCHKEWQQR